MTDTANLSAGERVRVLRIITRLNVGGPARQTVSLCRGLDPSRYDHRVLAGSPAAGEAGYLEREAPDVEVHHVPGFGRLVDPRGDARAFAALVREVRRFRPHIVHTHLAKAGLLGRLAAWLGSSAKTVHTFHGHLLYGILSARMTTAVTLTERGLARRTDRLVSVGARVRDELIASGIGESERFRVVPPGVDIGTVPESGVARAALGLPRDGLVVSFIARLSRQKRPERFIEIARALAQQHPDVTFAIFGRGDLESELRSRAADLRERVQFCGWRTDIECVLGATDLLVLTSDNEGMPVAAIEAAQAGVPVVATDVGSTREVVQDGRTGLVVPPEVGPLAEAVRSLVLDGELRRRLGHAAVDRAKREFGAARLVADIDAIYRELIPSLPGRDPTASVRT